MVEHHLSNLLAAKNNNPKTSPPSHPPHATDKRRKHPQEQNTQHPGGENTTVIGAKPNGSYTYQTKTQCDNMSSLTIAPTVANNPIDARDPHIIIQGFLETQLPLNITSNAGTPTTSNGGGRLSNNNNAMYSGRTSSSSSSTSSSSSSRGSGNKAYKWRNCYFVLRYNKIKNCSSLSCHTSDKITPQDIPCHIVDFYHVTCISTAPKYVIEIVSVIPTRNESLLLQCPDLDQFCQWMTHLEHVKSMSLFTCGKTDLQFSNISTDMLSSLKGLYNSVVQNLKREFVKRKQVKSHPVSRNSGNQSCRVVLDNEDSCSQKLIKQFGTIRISIVPSQKYDFLNRFEERSTSWWNHFRERYPDKIVFSDQEIPRSPEDDKVLMEEFNLGDPIYGRAFWPHAIRNYALGRMVTGKSRKGKETFNLIYGPPFRTVHSLFLMLFLKVDGVYQVGEGDEINDLYKCWAYANFGSYGAIQSDNEYGLGKIDFWAFNQTIKVPIFSFDTKSNPDSWELAAQNFVKLSLQLPLGRNYEIEFELRFIIRNPSTNSQIEPLFDTKMSAPISSGKFILRVPNPDDSSNNYNQKYDEWSPRIPKEDTCCCSACCDKLERLILDYLNKQWVSEVYNMANVPVRLCITGPRILLATQEHAIPTRVCVYQDPRNGWKCESVVMLQCSIIYKVKHQDKPPLSARRRQNTTQEKEKPWLCEYCDSELPDVFHSIVIHEKRKIALNTVPSNVWESCDRCPEHLRLVL